MIPALSLLGSIFDSTPAAATSSTSSAASVLGTNSVSALNNSNSAGSDFGQVLAQVATDASNNLKSAEATSIQGIQGKASVQQVVHAVTSAQESLQMAVAVRDKVVSAYQEISRMTI